MSVHLKIRIWIERKRARKLSPKHVCKPRTGKNAYISAVLECIHGLARVSDELFMWVRSIHIMDEQLGIHCKTHA